MRGFSPLLSFVSRLAFRYLAAFFLTAASWVAGQVIGIAIIVLLLALVEHTDGGVLEQLAGAFVGSFSGFLGVLIGSLCLKKAQRGFLGLLLVGECLFFSYARWVCFPDKEVRGIPVSIPFLSIDGPFWQQAGGLLVCVWCLFREHLRMRAAEARESASVHSHVTEAKEMGE